MSQRRLWTIGCILASLLAFPRDGTAGIIEIIIEMSGPQMIGGLVECRVSTQGELDACTVVGAKVAGAAKPMPRKLWFSLEGGLYVSTGKDAGDQNYEAGKTFMLAFDPMVEVQTITGTKFTMYHGVMGVSYNFLFGEGFRKFANVAFKIRPIGVIINDRFNVSYNLRLYPNGFTADEFGKLPPPTTENKPEAVHGISVGYRF